MTPAASPFRIVRAGREHLDLIAPLFDAYRQFYQQPPDVPRARAFLDDRLARGESVVFLALRDDAATAVGLGFTQLYPTFSSISLKPLWILNDLYVRPEARQQGVAKALMEAARRLGVETGAAELTLETGVDNLIAQRLYEQLGWERDVTFYRYALRL